MAPMLPHMLPTPPVLEANFVAHKFRLGSCFMGNLNLKVSTKEKQYSRTFLAVSIYHSSLTSMLGLMSPESLSGTHTSPALEAVEPELFG